MAIAKNIAGLTHRTISSQPDMEVPKSTRIGLIADIDFFILVVANRPNGNPRPRVEGPRPV